MKRKENIIVLVFLLFYFTATWDNSKGFEYKGGIFKCPTYLVDKVEFWKDIYTKYGKNHIVIHDRENPKIIYEIVDLEKEFKRGKYTARQKEKIIKKYKDKYIDIFSKLERYKGSGEKLSGDEHRIFKLFEKIDKRNKFYRAKRNIRTQEGLRDKFIEGLITRGKYIRKIREILIENGIPVEISALPHVESSFNTNARSKYGAVGIWQFTRSTGIRYLRINSFIDERKDPYASTRAVAKLFKKSYEELKSWPLAILAHNYGISGVKRAVRKLNTTDISVITEKYKTRRFGFASKNFYPEFLAALEVENNYQKYFGKINIEKNIEFESIRLTSNTWIYKLLEKLNIKKEEFAELNPHINKSVFSYRKYIPRKTVIYLPIDKYIAYKENFKNIEKDVFKDSDVVLKSRRVVKVEKNLKISEPDFSVYEDKKNKEYFWIYVNPEETIWHFAMWSGVSVNSIKRANNLRRSNSLKIHQKIKIPLSYKYYQKFEEERKEYHKKIEEEFFRIYEIESLIEHRIQKGENVWDICYHIYGVPLWLISKYNDLKKLKRVKPGDRIIIPLVRKSV
ncbi:MAG: transglycosylase SLT domain-containing protein [Candidatus Helarchaeota archaeon]|nr:transglycosylase SLT domain-containing protein [Candidatus Helarchaeota archaeon]